MRLVNVHYLGLVIIIARLHTYPLKFLPNRAFSSHFFISHVKAPAAYASHPVCNVGMMTGANRPE